MRQYRYFFLVGLIVHLTVIYVIIIQPTSDQINYINEQQSDISISRPTFKELQQTQREILNKRSANLDYEFVLEEIKKINRQTKYVPGKFQKIQGIFVFGAYLDHRLQGEPMVRILALQKLKDTDSLVCLFQKDEKYFLTYTEKYEMCENHGKVYGGYMYSCSIPKHFIGHPEQVTLTILTDDEQEETIYHTINLFPLHKSRNNTSDSIGICLAPLYGDIRSSQIIQFMELSKILQATNVFVYKFNVSKNTDILLNYYSADNFVKVIDWSIPENIQDYEIWSKGQLLAIQDCIYSNMNRFKYLLFLDLDEMLIPKTSMSWIEMIQELEVANNSPKVAAYSFRSSFFDPKYQSNLDQSIQFLQLRERTVSTSEVRSKVIIRPERVFEVGIHHLSRSLDDAYTSVSVDQSMALIHHYRPCVSNFDQTMKCYPTITDSSIEIFATELKEQVTKTQQMMAKVYNHFQNVTYL
ncbi:hypothetical protein SNE40_000349 [Patella caerulea]|uniref:Glycosyltransferase family 92 protein n=1 Tax=Patella caerulea TaxID=87958 RepID=A0AAN8KL26_PATCE